MPKRLPNEWYLEPFLALALDGKTVPPTMMQYVEGVVIEEEDEKYALWRVTIADREREWINDNRIKKGIPFSVTFGHRMQKRTIKGKIQHLEADYPEDGVPTLVIVGIETAATMNSAKKSRTWKNRKLSDVIREVFYEHGIAVIVQDTGKIEDTIAQSNETDMDFVKRKARERGFIVDKDPKSFVYYWGEKKQKTTVDILEYKKGERQIKSFSPVFQEDDIDDGNEDSKADVNINDGSQKNSQGDSSADIDMEYVLVDKSTGIVTSAPRR